MPVDDDTTNALRDAATDARKAQASDNLESIHEYGGRARKTLETINRNGMDSTVKELIEEAIRHAINAQRAVNPNGGRHDARLVREQITIILGDSDEPQAAGGFHELAVQKSACRRSDF
jgi:hypothetical protein